MTDEEKMLVIEYMKSQVIKEFWDIEKAEVRPNTKVAHNAPRFFVEISCVHKQTKEKRNFKTNAMRVLREVTRNVKRIKGQQKEETNG